jgi:hypothetical protein
MARDKSSSSTLPSEPPEDRIAALRDHADSDKLTARRFGRGIVRRPFVVVNGVGGVGLAACRNDVPNWDRTNLARHVGGIDRDPTFLGRL